MKTHHTLLHLSVVPGIATSTPESAGEIPPSQTSNKRAREDDDEGDGRSSAKKVDDKPDAPPIKIDMSRCGLDYVTLDSLAKKRARGEDGDDEGQGDAKKVHMKDEGS